ncbi:MAG: hypothetical protein M3487_03100, partial [Actinomycetota bacterium]|nr:hypothetical protein [Actinomycetota bacterium]
GDGAAPPVDVAAEWDQLVRPSLRGLVRALFTPVDVLGGTGATVTMAAPNTTHRDKCEQHRDAVERAWAAAAGRQVAIDLVVGGGADEAALDPASAAAPPGTPVGASSVPAEHESIDLDDLVDAAPGSPPVATTLDRLAEAFPGAELIEAPAERRGDRT